MRPGTSAGLGITVTAEREAVILISVATEATVGELVHYAVAMGPEVARHYGRSVRDMSREAEALQDELDDLDPEEVEDRLTAIRQRMASRMGSNGQG